MGCVHGHPKSRVAKFHACCKLLRGLRIRGWLSRFRCGRASCSIRRKSSKRPTTAISAIHELRREMLKLRDVPTYRRRSRAASHEAICRLLRNQVCHDFSGYKENTFAAAWKFGRSRFCRNILSVCGMILRKSNRFFATSKHGGGWAFPRNLGDLICSLQNNELGLAGHQDFLVCL